MAFASTCFIAIKLMVYVVLCLSTLLGITLLGGCAGLPTPEERGQAMDQLAQSAGWHKLRLPAGPYVLTSFVPAQQSKAPPSSPQSSPRRLTVYLEGDGLAWQTTSKPSSNPTPRKPVSLELALRHPDSAVAYLARPCQNVAQADWQGCTQADWTNARYSAQVIAASDRAIDALKRRTGATELVLVGYSGGGAVAALVAARRSDVVGLVTVAANLDTGHWTQSHGVTPLSGSLNPADAWPELQGLRQTHFVGGNDRVVTKATVESYTNRFPAQTRPPVVVVPDADHNCCWAQQWPQLWARAAP